MYYTIFQSWGQVTGSLMLGMEFTKMSAYFTAFEQVLTLIFIFTFQIPNIVWPEGLGALGMSFNYFITCLILAQCRVFVICRKLGMKVINEIIIPVFPIVLCSLIPYLLKHILNLIIPDTLLFSNFIKTILSGIIYSITIGYIIWTKPSLMGLTRESILSLLRRKIA